MALECAYGTKMCVCHWHVSMKYGTRMCMVGCVFGVWHQDVCMALGCVYRLRCLLATARYCGLCLADA